MRVLVNASIVLFHTKPVELERVIDCILKSNQNILLFLIDNSPTDDLRYYQSYHKRITYIHNPVNSGFGAAHNIAISASISGAADYHFVINPDIYFNPNVIEDMIRYMENDKEVGMMMPEILNFDGTIQYLPKLIPSPTSILWRKIKKPNKAYKRFIDKYELRSIPAKVIYNTPILSGCFSLLNLKVIKEVGAYDDRYFMYFEDFDLSRRINREYKTIYFPQVSVYHGYDSGANKSMKLFAIFIKSAINYFNKWGWFFDSERKVINKQTLEQF